MTKPVKNLRLFVAIYPPIELATAWRELLGSLDLPAHRLVPLEQIHLTLQFIGDTPVKSLDEVTQSVERSASGLTPFELSPKQLIRLPERGPARLIAMESDAPPTLLELKTRLAMRLAKNVRQKSARGFKPHFTLCRFRSPTRLSMGWPDDVSLPPNTLQPSTATRIALMRSTLDPHGARHTEVASFGLDCE